jgi:hypothetical protein
LNYPTQWINKAGYAIISTSNNPAVQLNGPKTRKLKMLNMPAGVSPPSIVGDNPNKGGSIVDHLHIPVRINGIVANQGRSG